MHQKISTPVSETVHILKSLQHRQSAQFRLKQDAESRDSLPQPLFPTQSEPLSHFLQAPGVVSVYGVFPAHESRLGGAEGEFDAQDLIARRVRCRLREERGHCHLAEGGSGPWFFVG